jgi:hypothetical protein
VSLKEDDKLDVLSSLSVDVSNSSKPIVKKGRPRKSDIEAKKKRETRGRPPGEAARIREFHARLLATTGDKIINTILKKALDDGDKDQVACLKMCVDRLLPMSYFEKEKQAGRGGINITISGIGGTTEITSEDTVDAEDVEWSEDNRG